MSDILCVHVADQKPPKILNIRLSMFHYAIWDNIGRHLSTQNNFTVGKFNLLGNYLQVETFLTMNGFNAQWRRKNKTSLIRSWNASVLVFSNGFQWIFTFFVQCVANVSKHISNVLQRFWNGFQWIFGFVEIRCQRFNSLLSSCQKWRIDHIRLQNFFLHNYLQQ